MWSLRAHWLSAAGIKLGHTEFSLLSWANLEMRLFDCCTVEFPLRAISLMQAPHFHSCSEDLVNGKKRQRGWCGPGSVVVLLEWRTAMAFLLFMEIHRKSAFFTDLSDTLLHQTQHTGCKIQLCSQKICLSKA